MAKPGRVEPYLWIDATYVKVRQSGRIVSVAIIVPVGVKQWWPSRSARHGYRTLRGGDVLDGVLAQAHATWPARRQAGDLGRAPRPSRRLCRRSLNASWQRCRVHIMRNALAHAGKQGRRVVSAFIATAFAQDKADSAKAQWRRVADQLRKAAEARPSER
jgi:putative transposase